MNKRKNDNTVSSKMKKLAKSAVKTWMPLEERHNERIVEGKKTKFPTKVILSILIITFSLMIIVASIVLVGTAKRTRNSLNDEIENLDFQIAELKHDLEIKNEEADIEIFAEEVLGMISQKHVNAEYIQSNKTDGIDIKEDNKVSFSTLIEWIFQQFK